MSALAYGLRCYLCFAGVATVVVAICATMAWLNSDDRDGGAE